MENQNSLKPSSCMVQLTPEQLGDISKYQCDTNFIYFMCVLKGEAAGIIWGDQETSPDFLLVWNPYQEGFQFMGKPLDPARRKEFRAWFDATIVPFLEDREMNYFEYGTDTKELAAMVNEVFYDYKISAAPQEYFHWSEPALMCKAPNGYQIYKVDREFYIRSMRTRSFY